MKSDLFNGELYDKYIKRVIDLLGSLMLIILFSPIFFLISMAIKFNTRGPVFADTPERVGSKARLFKMFKFRSMIENAHMLLRHDPKLKTLYEQYKKNSYKLRKDPRVTYVGKFIRKHSLDELPQLINVLKGDMSLVGPRAYYPDELVDQQKKYPRTKNLVRKVLSIKPGITGYWQVSGRSEVNFDKRIAMDANYVENRSLWYDMKILIKTPWAMISGKGAV
ncbi:exopolysaccharide biosynthesis protein [Candidatus Gottesmanbacteria bacterium CG11_big_fil_rev_8_21_14_0_20_37_11]|uniref:Exopolysaccharide biosynthesis protein n=2 Tax=Candidatus Gottesmaniibacteriota TaxID=1752720 RepID=A0A2M7RPP1_9BACT|nr:MAG: exopolysaccharide biosynthesis protein [Candidatus Gottesmanbacteria bacterium CG23_combo_of_CG06-09_8_20_14_all_37_19]PIR08579.1 MAG: exopolysaccharide biosynthesis protein [Candidatus Gottesmanbacteria bacterium CG11_big_fil_rev_8_21_14_0_20_37_11]PIZ02150.1 MAG: exopolysaccharide biosynthesis protein [Candidatus Gottesmanbacteria bacterium CG_4_10_14_0_8_um_filter_37_24]